MVKVDFPAGFATAIKNVHEIVNEAKSLHVVPTVYKFIRIIEGYLNEIEYESVFMESDEERYVGSCVMDYIKACEQALSYANNFSHTNEYRAINSVRDILQEFYDEYCNIKQPAIMLISVYEA